MPYTSKNGAHEESEVFYSMLVGSTTGKTGHNDDLDAYRHAYVSAVYAMERGELTAEILGTANEMRGDMNGQPPEERNMDMWNNMVGREAAEGATTKAQIAQRIADIMAQGGLVTDPGVPGHQYFGDSPDYSDVEQTDYDPEDIAPDPYEPYGQPRILPPAVCDALNPWGLAPTISSPIVLDLDGDGVELTTFNATTTETFFDINGDGFAEQTAWIGADDGLLARDVDESGTIDSVEELFGSPSTDGFALLAELDSNGDHLINQYDVAWSDLVVWKDANGDARTDDGELHSLLSLNIVSFDLAGVTASTSTINGNPISHTSTYTLSGGTTGAVADAWFVHDTVNTTYTGDYDLDLRALFLPKLRGYGKLADLTIVMSQNEELLGLVEDFVESWDISRFEDGASLDADLQEILWTWAGVESVASNSRGGAIDARKLEFLEEFFGNEFLQNGTNPNPYVNAAAQLNEAWERVFFQMKAQLMVQVGADAVFGGTISYNAFTGELEGEMELSQDTVDALELAAPASGVPLRHYWEQIGEFLAFTKGFAELETAENTMMNDAIIATDSGLSWSEVITTSAPGWHGYALSGTPDDDEIDGTAGSDVLSGGAGNDELDGKAGNDTLSGGVGHDEIYGGNDHDTLYGDEGNDHLYGGYGDDALYGGADEDYLQGSYGDDILNGGAGDDTAEGGQDDDTYEYTSGNDYYTDHSGADTIKLPSGITAGDLSFYIIRENSGPGDLIINISGLGSIQSDRFTVNTGTLYTYRIETLMFADTTTFDFSALTEIATYGTSANDSLYGVNFGSHLNDTLYGLGGNDQLEGYAGNDTLDGGDGNDRQIGGAGDDTFIMSAGFDTIEETSGADVLRLPEGYSLSDVTLIRSMAQQNNLIVSVEGLGQVELKGQLHYAGNQSIETISFNGTSTLTLTTAQIESIGTAGNDTLAGITSGASINDIMDGREGNDTLNGGAGDDTYWFSTGVDTINETAGTDVVKFRDGVLPGDITIFRAGSQFKSLIIEDSYGNKTTVANHFYVSASSVEKLVFSNSTEWLLSSIEIETRGTSSADNIFAYSYGDASTADIIYGYAGADQIDGGYGNDTIYGGDDNDNIGGDQDNDTLHGEGGDDYIEGGAGADWLYGGTGNDTLRGDQGGDIYYWIPNEGDDTLTEYNTAADNLDTLRIGGGYTINDLSVVNESTSHAKVTVSGQTGQLIVESLRGNSNLHVEQITFDDGFLTSLPDYNSWIKGSSGNDTVSGNSSDNTLIGFAGNDTMTGGAGNDDIHGGAGNDTLDGDDGTDLLYGGDGDDILYGEGGLDTLHGGAGADTFVFLTASAFSNVDVIRDFSAANDDVLDLTDILDTVYDPLTDDIADFISFSESSGSTFVSVDRDGTGGTYSMAQIVKLENVIDLGTPSLLETNGNLIAA